MLIIVQILLKKKKIIVKHCPTTRLRPMPPSICCSCLMFAHGGWACGQVPMHNVFYMYHIWIYNILFLSLTHWT